MSRQLPTRPSLEHLKKQAKERLVELQQQNPHARLAEALHELAREYGFSSWPKLKVAVEARQNSGSSAVARNPFAGVWTADVARSKRHPANQFQRATLRFAVDGDTMAITDVVVNASGQEDSGVNTIRVDGVEREPEPGGGYSLMARWVGSHAIETVAKKDGAIVGQGMYEVSADRHTLTVSTRHATNNADGWQSDFDHVIVFDRVPNRAAAKAIRR